jgi:hypothetical protein
MISRRSFLGTVGAASAAFTIVQDMYGGKGYMQPSGMVNLAGIGIGLREGTDIRGFAPPEELYKEHRSRCCTPGSCRERPTPL